jgi:hypothetical protein
MGKLEVITFSRVLFLIERFSLEGNNHIHAAILTYFPVF